MHGCTRFSQCRRLPNRRGAVFLLAVYFASLTLLILSGIAIQRTMLETRSAQLSRDLQQVFFLAEGAVDSALANIRTQSLLEGTPYYLVGLLGPLTVTPPPSTSTQDVASFTLESLSGGEVLTNGEQVVQRRIAATGIPSSDKQVKQVDLSAYYEEVGPVDGIWANGMIIVHGGWQPEEIFATGGMRSPLGAAATMVEHLGTPLFVPPGSTDFFGVTGGWKPDALKLDGAAYAQNIGALEGKISSELKSIKNAYKCKELSICTGPLTVTEVSGSPLVNGPVTLRAVAEAGTIGEQDQQMTYDTPAAPLSVPYVKTVGHVEGNMSLGTVRKLYPVSVPSGLTCQGTLWLPPGVTTISPNSALDVIGGDTKITLCVKAIVPQDDPFISSTIVDNPPELKFTAKAQIFVTGAEYFDLSASNPGGTPKYRVYVPIGSPGEPFGRSEGLVGGVPRFSFPASTLLPFGGMRYEWDVSVGATITAKDGADIVVTKQPSHAGRHSLVRIRPGQEFMGSIYAPESLVAVAERVNPPLDPVTGEVIPYYMTSIVGNDVIIELEADRVKLGWDSDPNAQHPQLNEFLGWMDGSAPSSSSTTNSHSSSSGLPANPACLAGADCF